MKSAKFKDSPLGPIPQDWEVKTIAEFGQVVTGSTPPRGDKDNWNGDFPWISAQDFGGKYIRESVEHISEQGKKFCRLLPADSVLVTCIASIGLNAIVKIECATNQQINAVICEKESPDFLYYTMEFNKARFLTLAGQTAVPIINKGQFETFMVPYPPLEEQQRIAEALGEVDKLIESLDEQIEKKRLIAKGVAHDLLGMRNDKNEPIRRLPGFKGAWEKKDYKDVFLHHKGKSIGTSEYESSGQFPVIDQGQEAVVAYSDNIDALFHVPDGGAIVFGDHTRIVKYVSKDFIVGADGTQILSGLGCDTQFLYHALRQIEIPNLGYNRHFKFIKNHQYSLPPTLAEQQAIVDMLSEQDAAIAALEAKREKYVRIKEGMMRDLLTGKVRMKGE